jgi:hypothetical protein
MEALIPSWVGNFAGEARVTPAATRIEPGSGCELPDSAEIMRGG